ncbi:hypothetical protein [Virgisporangium aurantiacum]|uniref:hypothetical protein n=1 Tax=Virgisporangium aurantiacum TaxID=175570 RepID=UPI0019507A40|nr:hypothetical protein [Virgisporangium aurantiacum]
MKLVRTARLRSRVDEAFRRHGGGWYLICGNQLVLVGPAFAVEKSVTIGRNGTAAASPDGKLLAVPGTDTLALYDDSGDQVTTVALRPWPDRSASAVTFSTDGTSLLAICAGQAGDTAEIRKVDGGAGWATTATATIPVTNDVYPAAWAHPRQSAYLVSIGAGQDGQWSWWITDDGALAATEITALRDRAVSGVTADRDTALTVPGAYGEDIAWHDLPGGNVIRRVDPAAIVGDDDEVHHAVDVGTGCLLVITGEGHALRVDHPTGRSISTARMPAADARSPFGWAGATTVTADELLLWDHDGGIALASLTGHAEDSTADA